MLFWQLLDISSSKVVLGDRHTGLFGSYALQGRCLPGRWLCRVKERLCLAATVEGDQKGLVAEGGPDILEPLAYLI